MAAARVRIVLCQIDAEPAQARRSARDRDDPDRARFHPEDSRRRRSDGIYDPPRLDVPTLSVEVSDGYRPDFDAIVEFARA
jgi:hypothetical protein